MSDKLNIRNLVEAYVEDFNLSERDLLTETAVDFKKKFSKIRKEIRELERIKQNIEIRLDVLGKEHSQERLSTLEEFLELRIIYDKSIDRIRTKCMRFMEYKRLNTESVDKLINELGVDHPKVIERISIPKELLIT